MRQVAFELHELLAAARVSGLLVLVGHSIGGLLVRLYAERYPPDVVGLVLVDTTHESSRLFNLRLNQWVRLRELAVARPVPDPRLEGPSSPNDDYLAEEFQQIHLTRRSNAVPLGDRPLIVLAAGVQPAPPRTSDELWKELTREKDEQKADLVRLSRNSQLMRDPTSRHEMPPTTHGSSRLQLRKWSTRRCNPARSGCSRDNAASYPAWDSQLGIRDWGFGIR